MQAVAFAVPILPGKADEDRQAMEACAHGARQQQHRASRERNGITREAVWLQPTPNGDIAVVYLEADDLKRAFDGLGSSDDEFDRWFRELVLDIHGIDLSQGFPPPEQVLDYRR